MTFEEKRCLQITACKIRMGIINAGMMRRYRRHVVVALLVVGAIITPTADVFTLLLVSMPMWLLFESSIWIVGRSKS